MIPRFGSTAARLKAHIHTPIVEESRLESVLESADYSSESADPNASATVGP